MNARIKRVFAAMIGVIMAIAVAGLARAEYPDRPITLIVGFPPGQSSDLIARLLAKKLKQTLGQPVIVENKAGAAGIIGALAVKAAKPDGYTLLFASSGPIAINPGLYHNLAYKPLKDFEPISLLSTVPYFMVVNKNVPVHSVSELMALVKNKPGQINYGSPGIGTTSNLAMELFKHAHNLDMPHIPYMGSTAAVTDLLAGRIDVMIDNGAALLTHIKAGKVRVIAVTTKSRMDSMPNIPTLNETGTKGYDVVGWTGLMAPKGTPAKIVNTLAKALDENWKDVPEVRSQLENLANEPAVMSPDAFGRFVSKEIDKWGEAVKLSGAKVN